MQWKTPPVRPQGPVAAKTIPVTDTQRIVKDTAGKRVERIKKMTVAPSGWSAERCRQGHFLPDSYPATSPHWTTCACGEQQDDDKFAVRCSSTLLLTSAAHAEQAIWWHVSDSANLFVNDHDHLMHWGEFDTVMHHFVTRLQPGRIMYLYSAMLLPDKKIGKQVFVENQSACEHDEIAQAYNQSGPTRYLNARERPGSISLLARKSDFNPHEGFDLSQKNVSVIELP